MEKTELAVLGIIAFSFVLGAYFYPLMPDKIASHWNAASEANGYMPKLLGVFLMPVLSAFLFLLFLAIPRIDPLKSNIAKFRGYYDGFVLLIIALLFYLYMLTIAWNMGVRFNIMQLLAPALGVMFYYSGILIENAKRNWFIGIRTPWTMSNDKVWDRTHAIGGKLFKASGVVAVAGMLFPGYTIFFVVVPIISSAIYAVVYSYLEYGKQTKRK